MGDSREKYGGMAHEESYEFLREFVKNPEYVHYVGMIRPPRPGIRLCMTRLEYTYFVPGTPSNNEFLLRIFKWCEIIWIMVSIPKEKSHLMEKVAAECGLRIIDGIPSLVGGGATDSFPVDNSNVFTLGNAPGHPVYSGDLETLEKILKEEKKEITAIEDGWRSRR